MNDTLNPNLLERVVPRVNQAMNDTLNQPYSADDVKRALFSIGDLKAPGKDGLHVVFFKKCWHILGDSITEEVFGNSRWLKRYCYYSHSKS